MGWSFWTNKVIWGIKIGNIKSNLRQLRRYRNSLCVQAGRSIIISLINFLSLCRNFDISVLWNFMKCMLFCHKYHMKRLLRSPLWAWLFLIDIRFTSHFGAWLLNWKKLTGHGLCCLKNKTKYFRLHRRYLLVVNSTSLYKSIVSCLIVSPEG